ncbi:MAG: hypothetical protein ABSE90_04010 [Verrucomicrobiota bacterium]
MNTKDFLRLGVPLGEATRRATDFVAQFILGGGASGSAEFIPLHRGKLRGVGKHLCRLAVVSRSGVNAARRCAGKAHALRLDV